MTLFCLLSSQNSGFFCKKQTLLLTGKLGNSTNMMVKRSSKKYLVSFFNWLGYQDSVKFVSKNHMFAIFRDQYQIKSKEIYVNKILLPHFMDKICIAFSIQLTSAQIWGHANVSM